MDEQPKRGRPRVSMTSRAEGAKNRNAALARRLQGNPFATGSKSVPVRDPEKWALRWANSDANENRHYQMTHDLGWESVTPADLPEGVTPDQIGLRVSEDGGLVRGVRGQERLYKMAAEDFAAVQQRKTEANLRGVGSAAKIRHDMANATASAHGSEAADYVHNLPGEVVDKMIGQ
jgi:hypothetical protein